MYKDPEINVTEKIGHILFSFQNVFQLYHPPISAALYDNKLRKFYPKILKSMEVSSRRLSEQCVLFRIVKCISTNSQSIKLPSFLGQGDGLLTG